MSGSLCSMTDTCPVETAHELLNKVRDTVNGLQRYKNDPDFPKSQSKILNAILHPQFPSSVYTRNLIGGQELELCMTDIGAQKFHYASRFIENHIGPSLLKEIIGLTHEQRCKKLAELSSKKFVRNILPPGIDILVIPFCKANLARCPFIIFLPADNTILTYARPRPRQMFKNKVDRNWKDPLPELALTIDLLKWHWREIGPLKEIAINSVVENACKENSKILSSLICLSDVLSEMLIYENDRLRLSPLYSLIPDRTIPITHAKIVKKKLEYYKIFLFLLSPNIVSPSTIENIFGNSEVNQEINKRQMNIFRKLGLEDELEEGEIENRSCSGLNTPDPQPMEVIELEPPPSHSGGVLTPTLQSTSPLPENPLMFDECSSAKVCDKKGILDTDCVIEKEEHCEGELGFEKRLVKKVDFEFIDNPEFFSKALLSRLYHQTSLVACIETCKQFIAAGMCPSRKPADILYLHINQKPALLRQWTRLRRQNPNKNFFSNTGRYTAFSHMMDLMDLGVPRGLIGGVKDKIRKKRERYHRNRRAKDNFVYQNSKASNQIVTDINGLHIGEIQFYPTPIQNPPQFPVAFTSLQPPPLYTGPVIHQPTFNYN